MRLLATRTYKDDGDVATIRVWHYGERCGELTVKSQHKQDVVDRITGRELDELRSDRDWFEKAWIKEVEGCRSLQEFMESKTEEMVIERDELRERVAVLEERIRRFSEIAGRAICHAKGREFRHWVFDSWTLETDSGAAKIIERALLETPEEKS